ncbi:hypothetical protein SLE2022_341280 [Rubroshorea leprosula]
MVLDGTLRSILSNSLYAITELEKIPHFLKRMIQKLLEFRKEKVEDNSQDGCYKNHAKYKILLKDQRFQHKTGRLAELQKQYLQLLVYLIRPQRKLALN